MKKINKLLSKIKKKLNNKLKLKTRELIYISIILILFGMFLGGYTNYKTTINNKSLQDFLKTYKDISKNYYEKINDEELLQSGLMGMMNYLKDPYSQIILENDSEAFKELLEGEYVGIGAEVIYSYINKDFTIGKIYKNSPSEKAGLKVGDKIIKIDSKKTINMSLEELSSMVKGPINTKVKLEILREKSNKIIEITRGKVDLISVSSLVLEKNNKKIGYLLISTIAKNTFDQFKESIENLKKENVDSLIIDLRNNNGGYLDVITKMINMFSKEKEIIYKLKTKGKTKDIMSSPTSLINFKTCVLVDKNTASAAEVFTAYLKENYKATIIGTNTFGKGKVQKMYQLSSGDIIKYTTEEWLTPQGNEIDKIGIKPDIEVEYKPTKESDTQIEKAINELIK